MTGRSWEDYYESLSDIAEDLDALCTEEVMTRIESELKVAKGVWVTSSDCVLLVERVDEIDELYSEYKYTVVCWNCPSIKDEMHRVLAYPTFSTGE